VSPTRPPWAPSGCALLAFVDFDAPAKPGLLGIWIFVLGHELTHAQQSDQGAPWGRPFDEVEADCGGYAKFVSLKLALGIKRAVQPPPRTFTRCPLKRARHR